LNGFRRISTSSGGLSEMKEKLAAATLVVLLMGLIAFFVSVPVGRATQQQDSSGNSQEVQEIRERIVKLEAQVASLEKQTKALEQRRVLTIPSPQLPQGLQMPPGSRQVEFNGLKYWFVPVHP